MKAILTIAAGSEFREIAALTHPLISAYARAIDADFISLNGAVARPHFAKFRIAEFLGIYPVLFMALTVSMLCELRTWLGLATFASLFWVGGDRR